MGPIMGGNAEQDPRTSLVRHGSSSSDNQGIYDESNIILKTQCIRDLLTSAMMANNKDEKHNVIETSKYPGVLHLSLESIEKMKRDASSTITFEIFHNNEAITSLHFNVDDFIKINQLIQIPLLSEFGSPVNLKVVISKHSNKTVEKAFEGKIEFSAEKIKSVQSRLEELKVDLQPYSSSIYDKIKSKLFPSTENNGILLRMYCAYIADSLVYSQSFGSLASLWKWIIFRKYSGIGMFKGIVNILGENREFIWRRRYIKWYGHTIYTFDLHTNELVGQIVLITAIPSLEYIKKGVIKFKIENREVKIHCDTPASLRVCIEATY